MTSKCLSIKNILRKIIPKPVRQFGWRLYYSVKNRGALTTKILDVCKQAMWNAEFISQPHLRRFVLEVIRLVGDLALLFNQIRGVDVYEINCESDGFLYSGSAAELSELNSHLFGDKNFNVTKVETVPVWKLPSIAEHYLSSGMQLAMFEMSRLFPFRFSSTYMINTPIWITQELSIPDDLDTMLSGKKYGSIRRIVNRAQRMDFNYYFTRDEADFDLFYHQMYVPLIVNRHKESGYVEPFESLHWWFKRGGLIMITQSGAPVAASLVAKTKQKGLFVDIGVLDADQELIQTGIQTITVWSMIQWFFSQGVRLLDMGGSKALRSNGVFVFKHRWGAKAQHLYSFIRSRRILLMKNPSDAALQRVHELGLITESKRKFFGVQFLENFQSLDISELREVVDQAIHEGLSGTVVVSPDQNKVVDESGFISED